MKVSLDTSVLGYAERIWRSAIPLPHVDPAEEERKSDLADRIVAQHAETRIIVSTQALGELFTILVRKARVSADQARHNILTWRRVIDTQPTTDAILLDAFDLAVAHRLQIWDAIILAAAAEAGVARLLTEDAALLRVGVHRGVAVENPFAA